LCTCRNPLFFTPHDYLAAAPAVKAFPTAEGLFRFWTQMADLIALLLLPP
jgi:hypothetical protein